jgi:hypothetical protein
MEVVRYVRRRGTKYFLIPLVIPRRLEFWYPWAYKMRVKAKMRAMHKTLD